MSEVLHMGSTEKAAVKTAKKQAKALQKVAKQRQRASAVPSPAGDGPGSPAERAARAAEQKLGLERWRTWLAAVGVLIALLSVVITYLSLR